MKICIVKLSALGDIIHSMIVLQFIKQKYPHYKIDWIVESAFVGILENNPHIDNILPVNLKSIKKDKKSIFSQLKLIKEYQKNNYDVIIDAQGLIKSAIVSKLLSKNSTIVGFCKASIRESFASYFYSQKVSIAYDKNIIQRNIKLFSEALNLKISHNDILNKKTFLFSKSTTMPSSDILFVLGASTKNKIYPKEKFVEIANALQEYKIDVIWATEDEKLSAQYVHNNASNITLCKKMSLDNLKEKINQTKLVIGGDTGPTHMAWGLNKASITIFGNTPEYRNTYRTDINKIIKSDSEVNPYKLDKNDFSITEIDSSRIVEIAKSLKKK